MTLVADCYTLFTFTFTTVHPFNVLLLSWYQKGTPGRMLFLTLKQQCQSTEETLLQEKMWQCPMVQLSQNKHGFQLTLVMTFLQVV